MVSCPLNDWPFDGIQMTKDAASKGYTFEGGGCSGSVYLQRNRDDEISGELFELCSNMKQMLITDLHLGLLINFWET